MIPVLGVPIISRPDLLERMLASVDVPVGRRVIVDNGNVVPYYLDAVRLPANLGIAASWNLVIKLTPDAPWWLLANADVVFAPGDLAHLADEMADPAPKVRTMDGFAAFAVNAACIETVGWFDENYHPAYVEDCDYEYRCKLLGVPIVEMTSSIRHDTSSTIKADHYRRQNSRTYPSNVAYHIAKWGGAHRGGERFRTPFDHDTDPADWTLDLARLRDNAWETTALVPDDSWETR